MDYGEQGRGLVKVSDSVLTTIPTWEQKLSLMMLILTVNELSETCIRIK